LSTESSVQAQELATKLNLLNQQRQDLTRHYITIAEEMISKIKDNLVYVIYGDDWPEGIIGLIAGSLSHSCSRPVLVATRQGDIIKGSARSIENFNIAEALRSLDSILERHGGHAQAAGFQLKSDMIEEFIKSLNALVSQQLTNESLIPVLHIDSVIEIDEIDIDLFEEIQKLEPFGQLNSEPTLALMDVSAEKVSTVGKDKQHMKFELTHNNKKVDAIAFNSAKKFLPILSSEKSVSVAFKLLKNTWNGKTKIQVRVIDVKNSSEVNTNY
jgi:single-stranded-DNA-specific exonuclease